MPESAPRKHKSSRSTRGRQQPTLEQKALARKSLRDHLAIIACAVAISLVAYVYRTYFQYDVTVKHVPMFEVRDIEGKGKGVIALRKIEPGELIMKEQPLFVVPSSVMHTSPGALLLSALARLTPSQRDSFYNLSYVNLPEHLVPGTSQYHEGLALAIFQTNAVAAGESAGIFPGMARLNHGCSSAFNSVYSWRDKEGVIVVHALKRINQGQEILTTYSDTKRPRDERRQFLRASYGFTCRCSVCSLPSADSKASDARLTSMAQLYAQFSRWSQGVLSGRAAIDTVNDIWKIEEEEGYYSERGQLAADAALVAASHSDEAAVRTWAELARTWYSRELGADSEQAQTMGQLAARPDTHPRWRTRVDEMVGGLNLG